MILRRHLPFTLLAGLACVAGARAAELTFDLTIANGQVPADKRLIRVKQGDVVKLRWRADRRTEIHLHGYDISKTVGTGAVTELTFTARATGRFTVEPHVDRQGGGHSHGSVLVTIEVYP
jgi:FtsP/CotA-like multicopper oxidase with cupredoxin domain